MDKTQKKLLNARVAALEETIDVYLAGKQDVVVIPDWALPDYTTYREVKASIDKKYASRGWIAGSTSGGRDYYITFTPAKQE